MLQMRMTPQLTRNDIPTDNIVKKNATLKCGIFFVGMLYT